ncbi:MAG: TerB family tellurite resistance protein [Pseudomonadota bacterium]
MANFFSRLFGGSRPTAPERNLDPYEAATALLIEAALIDGVYANIESDMIAELLVTSFGMDAQTADATLKKAEILSEQAVDAHALTRHVKTLDEGQRTALIEALYKVSFADGESCKFEEAYIRHVASLLHIDDAKRTAARRRAEIAAP